MMIRSALDQGAVDTLLLSKAYGRTCWLGMCVLINGNPHKIVAQEIPNCPKCGSEDVREDPNRTRDIIDELTELAGHTSAKLAWAMESEEGATLQTSFGGIAAHC